jgi:CubicO group peptidase (beta-lactamase class C family)
MGWDSPSEENGMLECGFSKQAIGMNGFTGCSLWLDPETGVDIILLSNRVHPSRHNKKIRNFRPQIHAAIHKALRA